MANHQDVVAQVKADLVAAGADLSGAAGAFKITLGVAWALRGEGFGLLKKTSGNNFGGYAVDVVLTSDFQVIDILGDSGGANNPQWNPEDTRNASFFATPFDPNGPFITNTEGGTGGGGGGGGNSSGGGGGGSTVVVESKGPGHPSTLISPQLGLLEDDIVYRLALLCVNILQPLRNKYPNIVVTSGFRQPNTGISQHELAEAADIQIRNQTPELIYEVADYIQKNLPFDQLVLNWTTVGSGQPWIHVSFSADSLRGQVLTKDFADNFHDGLFIVEPLTGEAAAAALRAQAATDSQILIEMQNMQTREERLGAKSSVIGDAVAAETTTTTSSNEPDDGPGPPLDPRIIEICRLIWNQSPLTADSDDGVRRDLTRKVAEQICYEFGPTWGHKSSSSTAPPSADVFAQIQPDGSLYGWDWQSPGTHQPNPNPRFYNLRGQHFIEVPPVNHLG